MPTTTIDGRGPDSVASNPSSLSSAATAFTWKDRGFFWLLWVWACTLGLEIGIFFGRVLGHPSSGVMFTFLQNIIGGVILGTTIGFAQWLILRHHFPREPFWLLANTIGWGIGWEVGWAMHDRFKIPYGSIVAWTIGWTIIGLLVGLSGWFILRRHVRRASWWVVANVVGAALGGSLGGYGYQLAFEVIQMIGASRLTMIVAIGSTFLGPGLIYGTVTGGVLAWLISYRRHPLTPRRRGGQAEQE